MANLYYNLIKQGLWQLEQVPYLWKPQVEKLLAADSGGEIKTMETV